MGYGGTNWRHDPKSRGQFRAQKNDWLKLDRDAPYGQFTATAENYYLSMVISERTNTIV